MPSPLVFLLAFTLILPVIAAIVVALLHKKPRLRDGIVLGTSFLLAINVANLLFFFTEGGEKILLSLTPLVPLAAFSFSPEPLGLVFACMVSCLWIVTVVYSIGYLRANQEQNQTRFHICMALSIAATLGVAFAGNLVTLFICYELLTFSTYPLIVHHGTRSAYRAGVTYLLYLAGSSLLGLLPAIVMIAVIAGHTSFLTGGTLNTVSASQFAWIVLLTVYGLGKAALMPMHRWLPAAMVAPSPVSALLHAVAVVKTGVFILIKMSVYIFDIHQWQAFSDAEWWAGEWLVYVAGFSIILSSYIALKQENLKTMLAYSTISQLAYIVMAVSLASPKAVIAAFLHMVAHAFGKITLFFAAGALYTSSHKTTIPMLNGMGRLMPWTMTAFTIAALSMIGLPPLAGSISKYFLLVAAWDRMSLFAIGVIILSTLLNATYFIPILYRAFFCSSDMPDSSITEAPLSMRFALCLTAAATVLFGWLCLWLVPWLEEVIR